MSNATHQAQEHVHGPHCSHDHCGHGQAPYVRAQAKIGRNDPCPCQSGKKYKKCCGNPLAAKS